MKNKLKLSIVIPSYNKGKFIEETLLSIIKQKTDSIEIILVDGGSSDETDLIINKYIDYIDILIKEPDFGQSDAINKGVARASGDIIGWLNADDLLYNNSLLKILDVFKENPAVGAVYGTGSKIDLNGYIIKEIPYRPFNKKLLKNIFYILQPSFFFKKDIFCSVGCLNIHSNYAMDWELALKISKMSDIISIPDKIAKLRIYNDTKTSKGGWDAYIEISRIGRNENGIFDVNLLSFFIRNIVCSITNDFLKGVLKKIVDLFFSRCIGSSRYMICKWPEDFK